MKTILPKGSVAVRCISAPIGGTTTAQNPMPLPGSTILVIPPNIRSVSHYKINNNLTSDNSLHSLALPSAFVDQTFQHQDENHNKCETIVDASSIKNTDALSNNLNVKNNMKRRQRKNKPKERKRRKCVLKGQNLVRKKVENDVFRSNETTYLEFTGRSGSEAHVNDSHKGIVSEIDFLNLQNSDLADKNAVGSEPSTQHFSSLSKPTKRQCISVPYLLAEDPVDEIRSREINQIIDHNDLIQRSSHMRVPGLRAGSPPSYEAHVCSVPPTATDIGAEMQIPNTEYPDNICVPPSYTQSSQDRNTHLYMSHNYNHWSSPIERTMGPGNLTYDTPMLHEQLHYDALDSREAEFTSADPSSSLDINYFYAPQLNSRNSDPNSSKYFGTFADSSGWHFENYAGIEDEPRDYSNSNNLGSSSTYDKQLLENINCIEEFVESAERQLLLNEDKEQSYEERRRLALNVLNSNDSESDRKQALKENFWIVEDEPLQRTTFNKTVEPQCFPEDAIKPPLLKPRPSKEFICHICGKTLKGRSSLRSHVHLHLNIKPYCCPYCGKKFTQSSILRNHIRIHTGETPYGCEKCGKAFKTKSILQKHLSKHSKVRAFKCCVCSKCFKTATDLRNHLKIHTSGPHLCSFCKKLYDSRSALSSHIQRKHKNQNRYHCPECNKGYSLKCLLKQHMNVHSNEQKHSCHVCGASYVWKSGLAAHLRTHSFRIQCEICGDKFLSLKKLQRHRTRHAEPSSHKCPKCDRKFKLPYLLKNHLAKHVDELSCKECGIGFITKTKLKKHLKIHTQSRG